VVRFPVVESTHQSLSFRLGTAVLYLTGFFPLRLPGGILLVIGDVLIINEASVLQRCL
jgi:hypothetical protein